MLTRAHEREFGTIDGKWLQTNTTHYGMPSKTIKNILMNDSFIQLNFVRQRCWIISLNKTNMMGPASQTRLSITPLLMMK